MKISVTITVTASLEKLASQPQSQSQSHPASKSAAAVHSGRDATTGSSEGKGFCYHNPGCLVTLAYLTLIFTPYNWMHTILYTPT